MCHQKSWDAEGVVRLARGAEVKGWKVTYPTVPARPTYLLHGHPPGLASVRMCLINGFKYATASATNIMQVVHDIFGLTASATVLPLTASATDR